MKKNFWLQVLLAALTSICFSRHAWSDTFGSGVNTFDIEFVRIGSPGNVPDTAGDPNPAGAVDYAFRMGKFEISEQMINKANILGGLGLTTDIRGPDKPATSITWNEAARFINWLNTSTGHVPAYKFAAEPGEIGYSPNANIELWTITDPGYNPNNLYRNRLALYFLPSVDEWYKAAYYDAANGVYYHYPTGSNGAPTPVASGTAAGTAIYDQSFATGPADITLAGGLSPFGTMGQGGNVYEWEETDFDLVNDSSSSPRGNRGGGWEKPANHLARILRIGDNPFQEGTSLGFRVASIPEPGTMLLAALAAAALWTSRKREIPGRNRPEMEPGHATREILAQ
jgi:sulfatase modifying factor 1